MRSDRGNLSDQERSASWTLRKDTRIVAPLFGRLVRRITQQRPI
jgi:hypothetical protein